MNNFFRFFLILVVLLCTMIVQAQNSADGNARKQEIVELYRQGRQQLQSNDELIKKQGIESLQNTASAYPEIAYTIGTLFLRLNLHECAENVLKESSNNGDVMATYELGMLYLTKNNPKEVL